MLNMADQRWSDIYVVITNVSFAVVTFMFGKLES